MPKKNAEIKSGKKQIPIEEGLFTMPSPLDQGHLIGSKCSGCGRVFFPKITMGCPVCYQESEKLIEEISLSTRGKVHACTVFRYKNPPPGYKGEVVPYAYGYVELPEGVIVPALFTDYDLKEPLKVGTEVELKIEKFASDEEGNEIIAFKFLPI